MFIKAKESGQFDIVSADALWVPYYYQQGLTYPFDIKSIPVSQAALLRRPRRSRSGRQTAEYLAYPRAWSALRIYYNPKFVHPAPTSYDVLLDPKYKGKFVRENQPTDIMAEAGLATGVQGPVQHDHGRAQPGHGVAEGGQAGVPDARLAEHRRGPGAHERVRVVHLGEPRHGHPSQGGRWTDHQGAPPPRRASSGGSTPSRR